MIKNIKPNKPILILLFILSLSSFGKVKLPKFISDGMVLQRNTEVIIWGWAAEGENVSVSFIDSTYTAVADNEGCWSIVLPELNAGGPFEMNIKASNTITIKDI